MCHARISRAVFRWRGVVPEVHFCADVGMSPRVGFFRLFFDGGHVQRTRSALAGLDFFRLRSFFVFAKIPVILWIHLVIRSSTADYAKEQGSTIICVHALINKLHCFFLNTMIILGYSLIIIYFVCNTYSVSEFNVFICRCRCVK